MAAGVAIHGAPGPGNDRVDRPLFPPRDRIEHESGFSNKAMSTDNDTGAPTGDTGPPPRGRLVSRRSHLIERFFTDGIREYGGFPLDHTTFARELVRRVERRLSGAGLQDTGRRLDEALAKIAGTDLYLTIACDRRLEAAWQTLADRYFPRLERLLEQRGTLVTVAKEIVANLPGDLIAPPPKSDAATRIGTYDGFGSLFYWLVTFVLRKRNERTRRVEPRAGLEKWLARVARETGDPGVSPDDPASAAYAREACDRLRTVVRLAWARLTPRHLLVLRCKFLHSLSQKEVARMLGVSEALVSHLLHEGMGAARMSVMREFRAEARDCWPGLDQLWGVVTELLTDTRNLVEGQDPLSLPRSARNA